MSDELLDAAMALAFAFDMKDKSVLVKKILGLEFRIYSVGLDDDRVLDRIEKGTVSTFDESLRNLCRAMEEIPRALEMFIEALEKNVQRAESFIDRTQ